MRPNLSRDILLRPFRTCGTAARCYSVNARHSRANSIGFIGLGRMGSEMAYNLLMKRYKLAKESKFVICDAVPEAAQAFARRFKQEFPHCDLDVVHTPQEAALASRIIVTMLPSSPQVEAVYADAAGIASALESLPEDQAHQTLCIDSTTLDVNVARQISSKITSLGVQMIDAPVSGGVTGAMAGSLSFLVGGTKEAFEISEPILSLMGKRIIHCGASGSGLVAKICNNLMLGVQQIVTAEAMLLGQRLGVKADVLADVINSSTGACWSCSANNPVPGALADKSPPSERNYEGGFATALMLKDMGLALKSAKLVDSTLPLGSAAQELYANLVRTEPELAQKDFSSVYRYLEKKQSTD